MIDRKIIIHSVTMRIWPIYNQDFLHSILGILKRPTKKLDYWEAVRKIVNQNEIINLNIFSLSEKS